MESQIFTDLLVKPENDILEIVLGKNYKLYSYFENRINELNLVLEWNYYNITSDGKSWLCKILNKNKNLGWISVWNIGIKLTLYFSEKTINGVYELDIDEEIKNITKNNKKVHKLYPVIILLKNKKMVNNGLKILEYKMQIK